MRDRSTKERAAAAVMRTRKISSGSGSSRPDVTRVILFKSNLEKVCSNRDDLVEQIQVTVRHEIGHHLGLSEEDLERLGLA